MRIAAAVVATVATATYGATLPRLAPIDPSYAPPIYYVVSLSPVAALLLGAALAFLARDRWGGRPGSLRSPAGENP